MKDGDMPKKYEPEDKARTSRATYMDEFP